jgi:hypothetical protein
MGGEPESLAEGEEGRQIWAAEEATRGGGNGNVDPDSPL